MTALLRFVRFVNIFAAAFLAGGQFFVLQVVVPVKLRVGRRESVLIHQEMLHDQADTYLLPAVFISTITSLPLILLKCDRTKTSATLNALGFLGFVGVAITSERFNKPTNRMILGWSLDAIPDTYPRMRDAWDMVHSIRTVSGVFMFACHLAAALASRPKA